MTWGPFVLAGLPSNGKKSVTGSLAEQSIKPVGKTLTFEARLENTLRTLAMVPFAEAGKSGERYKIWLNAPGSNNSTTTSVFEDGEEKVSTQGNVEGSFNDGDPGTFAVTYDGKQQSEAWFSVTSTKAEVVSKVTYIHGHSFHDGGWFDASHGKPQIQIQDRPGSC